MTDLAKSEADLKARLNALSGQEVTRESVRAALTATVGKGKDALSKNEASAG